MTKGRRSFPSPRTGGIGVRSSLGISSFGLLWSFVIQISSLRLPGTAKYTGTHDDPPHGPHSPDPDTPLEETLAALDRLVQQGKVRYLGCSNYPAWQVALALGHSARLGLARFDCVQPRYNLLYREIESELLPLCRDQGLGVIAYNPLAGGFLSGRYQQAETQPPAGTRFALGKTGDLYRERYWQQAQFEAVGQLR